MTRTDPLQLTYAGFNYLDRTLAMQLGEIQPQGIDVRFVTIPEIGALFRRMAQHQEFDVAEMSLSTLMVLGGRGVGSLVGIPVFPSRTFRHGFMFVRRGSSITSPEQLRGATIGIQDYQATAYVWLRAILQHDYGVAPTDVTWVVGGLDVPEPLERLHHAPPVGVEIRAAGPGKTLERMLADGDVDAVLTPERLHTLRGPGATARRLLADHETVERAFFARTGFFPIMHVVAMRRDVYEADPWIARAMMDAFQRAKEAGTERMRKPGSAAIALPWLQDQLADLDASFDGDLFPIGLPPNRPILEAMARYSHEQGLSEASLRPEDIFAAETWDYLP